MVDCTVKAKAIVNNIMEGDSKKNRRKIEAVGVKESEEHKDLVPKATDVVLCQITDENNYS